MKLNHEAEQKSRQNICQTKKNLSDSDFKKIIYSGRKISNQFFAFFYLPNKFSYSRFGFSVPKRLGVAVQRNRMKRVLREIFRHNTSQIKGSIDGVLIVKFNFLKFGKVKYYQLLNGFVDRVIQRKFTGC